VLFLKLVVSTYLNNNLQENKVVVSNTIAIDLSLLSNDGTAVLGFNTTLPFNEIRIRIKSLVSILNTVQVYHAVAQQYCEGASLSCNVETRWVQPLFPVAVEKLDVSGIAVGNIENVNHLLDVNDQNFASFPISGCRTSHLVPFCKRPIGWITMQVLLPDSN
jgi:hypothetical protein